MGRPRKDYPGRPKVYRSRERIWWRGRWHDLGPAGSKQSREKYARLVLLWAADPAAVPLDRGAYLVAELVADYLQSADCPTGDRQLGRVVTATGLLCELYGETEANEFKPPDLRSWQRHLCTLKSVKDENRTRFNVTTCRDLVGAVQRVWKWGVSTGRVREDVYRALLTVPPVRPGEARPKRIVLSADPEHVEKTLPFLRGPVRAMVLLEWHTGARPDELCRMRAGDVKRTGKVELPGIGVKDLTAAGVWVYVVERHKTAWRGKSRVLFFGPAAQAVLGPFLDRDPAAYCFSPREAVAELRAQQRAEREARDGGSGGNRKKPAKKARPLSDHYTPRTYRQAIERACVRAGVPHFYPYRLRHLAASEIKASADLDAVQAMLGHHTRTMAEMYGAGRSTGPRRRPAGAGNGAVVKFRP